MITRKSVNEKLEFCYIGGILPVLGSLPAAVSLLGNLILSIYDFAKMLVGCISLTFSLCCGDKPWQKKAFKMINTSSENLLGGIVKMLNSAIGCIPALGSLYVIHNLPGDDE